MLLGDSTAFRYFSRINAKPFRILTVTGHADRQAFFEAAVLATVSVHAHDHAVFVLHAHLVVNVLLNASPKKTLQQQHKRHMMIHASAENLFLPFGFFIPCILRMHAHHSEILMQYLHTLYIRAPCLLFLFTKREIKRSGHECTCFPSNKDDDSFPYKR